MILAVLQARTSSSRLPSKVLLPLLGKPMLARQIERIKAARLIDHLVVATSEEPSDDPIEEIARSMEVSCYRGSLDDVLDRFYQAASKHRPEHIVRLTGDCPLTDASVLDATIRFYLEGGYDYVNNCTPPTFPDGLDAEVFSFSALRRTWETARLPSQREHVTPYMYSPGTPFKTGCYSHPKNLSALRWTVDEPRDFEFVREVYDRLYPAHPRFGMEDVLRLLQENPELSLINSSIERNEGMKKSLEKDKRPVKETSTSNRYRKSGEYLARAEKVIPLGSQTFSKSKTQYPIGVSPLFVKRAKGSKVWDIDGNEYLDLVSSLASVTLGHCDPDVTEAVRNQIDEGTIFTLSHPIETLVAEKLVEMVPCAEKARFGKNGSDATAGAIRVARAHTGRDHVIVCGYHGWQDWYIGSTARNKGVPKSTQALTHRFEFNKIESLHQQFKAHPGEIAAVILEPMNVYEPQPGFLAEVKELTHKNGAVLIFDETITGFRYAQGGAQEHFGVTPDLCTLGKGMANGYPVSAVVGSDELMKEMEEIFFSFTFGGETVSLAAALATLTKIQTQPVLETLAKQGQKIKSGVSDLIGELGLQSSLEISGHPSWTFLSFKDTKPYSLWELKTLYMQELFARGILSFGTHNMSYAHTDADVQKLLSSYREIFTMLKDVVENQTLHQKLRCKPLEPLFKVR